MMKALSFVILSALLLPGCILLLGEPADFPESDPDAECIHDAAQADAWEFKSLQSDLDAGANP